MTRALAFLLALLLPLEALALSCQRPSVARSFMQAQEAEALYVVVKGRLTLQTRKLPRARQNDRARKITPVPARLQGAVLSRQGFDVPFDRKITLEVACFGPWCGSAQNGEQVLAFVRREGGQLRLSVTPCGGFVFANPKPAMLKEVQRCYRRGRC